MDDGNAGFTIRALECTYVARPACDGAKRERTIRCEACDAKSKFVKRKLRELKNEYQNINPVGENIEQVICPERLRNSLVATRDENRRL